MVTCPCRFTDCNTCSKLVGDVGGEAKCVWARGYMENLDTFLSIPCEPKTKSFFLIKNIQGRIHTQILLTPILVYSISPAASTFTFITLLRIHALFLCRNPIKYKYILFLLFYTKCSISYTVLHTMYGLLFLFEM